MPPFAREIIDLVAAEHGVAAALLTGRSRKLTVVFARREAMRRLYATGRCSSTMIGRFLGNRDHTTVLYSIGHNKKHQPPLKLRWRKPWIAHLRCHGCPKCLRKPDPVSRQYRPRCLIPYAGADMTEYQWTARP